MLDRNRQVAAMNAACVELLGGWLGGRVSFETSARDGTTFELALPRRAG